MAMNETPNNEELKVAHIFRTFDTDNDGALSQEELTRFIYAANPGIPLTAIQMQAIVEEVFEEYAAFVNDKGLTLGGLLKSYADGVSDIDTDFAAIGLEVKAVTPSVFPRQLEAPKQPSRTDAASEPASAELSPFRDRTNSLNSPTQSPQPAGNKGEEGKGKGSPFSPSKSQRRRAERPSASRLTKNENADEILSLSGTGSHKLHGTGNVSTGSRSLLRNPNREPAAGAAVSDPGSSGHTPGASQPGVLLGRGPLPMVAMEPQTAEIDAPKSAGQQPGSNLPILTSRAEEGAAEVEHVSRGVPLSAPTGSSIEEDRGGCLVPGTTPGIPAPDSPGPAGASPLLYSQTARPSPMADQHRTDPTSVTALLSPAAAAGNTGTCRALLLPTVDSTVALPSTCVSAAADGQIGGVLSGCGQRPGTANSDERLDSSHFLQVPSVETGPRSGGSSSSSLPSYSSSSAVSSIASPLNPVALFRGYSAESPFSDPPTPSLLNPSWMGQKPVAPPAAPPCPVDNISHQSASLSLRAWGSTDSITLSLPSTGIGAPGTECSQASISKPMQEDLSNSLDIGPSPECMQGWHRGRSQQVTPDKMDIGNRKGADTVAAGRQVPAASPTGDSLPGPGASADEPTFGRFETQAAQDPLMSPSGISVPVVPSPGDHSMLPYALAALGTQLHSSSGPTAATPADPTGGIRSVIAKLSFSPVTAEPQLTAESPGCSPCRVPGPGTLEAVFASPQYQSLAPSAEPIVATPSNGDPSTPLSTRLSPGSSNVAGKEAIPEPDLATPVSVRRKFGAPEPLSQAATPEHAPSLLAVKAAWLDWEGGQHAVTTGMAQAREGTQPYFGSVNPLFSEGGEGAPGSRPRVDVALRVAMREHAVEEEVARRKRAFQRHVDSGLGFAKREQHGQAVASFKQALTILPDNARCLFRLGNSLYSLRHLDHAQRAYQAALQVARLPGDASLLPKVHVNLGITLEGQGCLLEACNHYREAVQLNPNHSRGMKLLGSVLYALGDLPAARTALEFSLHLQPAYADAHCDLGCTLCALGEAENARASFKEALDSQPNHQEALFNLGNLDRQCGDFKAALASYDALLEQDPSHWRAHINKAVALLGLSRSEEAQSALEAALAIAGESEELRTELANLKVLAQSGSDQATLSTALSNISDKAITLQQGNDAASSVAYGFR